MELILGISIISKVIVSLVRLGITYIPARDQKSFLASAFVFIGTICRLPMISSINGAGFGFQVNLNSRGLQQFKEGYEAFVATTVPGIGIITIHHEVS